jgi:hypothetical protein
MSVKKGGNGPMTEALQAAGVKVNTNADEGQSTQQQQNPRRTRGSIMDVNTRHGRPMSRASSAENVQAYLEALSNTLDKNMGKNYRDTFQLLVLDNNRAPVAFSSILVCHQEREKVTVYTLIVEGSGSKLNNQYVSISGQQCEVEIVTADIYNQESFWQQIEILVNEHYGVPGLVIRDAGGMVLPEELKPTDEVAIRRVAVNAVNAAYTIMDMMLDTPEAPFSVSSIGQNDLLTATLDFSGEPVKNAVDLPIRADVKIKLRGSVQANNTIGLQQVRDMTEVDGYIDLVFQKPAQPAYGQAPMTQSYYPRFVITRAQSDVDAETLELQLLALHTSAMLAKNMAWAGVYKPRYIDGIDMRDIGAIGYEINLTGDPNQKPERIDTKSDAFGLMQLQQLVSATINDSLIYSMDIEEVGELSWIHQVFIAAANGDESSYNMLITAANNLTNGTFNQFFSGEPICYDEGNRIHLGYYVDEHGERRDLRDLDYLAVLNLVGKSNPGMVEEWENTFTQTDVPLEIRLERRRNMMKALYSGKMEVKGFARRITFNPNFIIGLSQACERAGLVVRPGNLVETFGAQHVRGQGNYAQYGVHAQQLGSAFSYNQPQYGGQRFVNPTYVGRTWPGGR